MKKATSLILSVLLLLSFSPQTATAQRQDELQRTSERIVGTILVGGHSMDYLRGLADGFGGRLTGSPAYRRAAEWAAAQFRAAGIKDVRLEPFTIEHGWERGAARGMMLTPLERPLHIESVGWSPSTPAEGIKGEVFLVNDVSPKNIQAQADKIKDHIVLLDQHTIFAEGLENSLARLIASYQPLKDAGAKAILWGDVTTNNDLHALNSSVGTGINPLPMATIGGEDSKLIQRLMKKGSVTVQFQYENRITGAAEVNTVVAEIRGREKPEEWILVGAHLDSWDFGTGAQDNGSGCAMVLETARAIVASGVVPRRSIRFALWAGEEQWMLGSRAYVRAHSAELDNCVAMLNTDSGAGHPLGWKVQGRADVRQAMKPISESLLTGLGGDGLIMRTTVASDHLPFLLKGIPTLALWDDTTHYGEVHHLPSDTLDKIDAHNLAADAAVMAVTAYALADRLEPIAPHIDRASVLEILKREKFEGFVNDNNLWN